MEWQKEGLFWSNDWGVDEDLVRRLYLSNIALKRLWRLVKRELSMIVHEKEDFNEVR